MIIIYNTTGLPWYEINTPTLNPINIFVSSLITIHYILHSLNREFDVQQF